MSRELAKSILEDSEIDGKVTAMVVYAATMMKKHVGMAPIWKYEDNNVLNTTICHDCRSVINVGHSADLYCNDCLLPSSSAINSEDCFGSLHKRV